MTRWYVRSAFHALCSLVLTWPLALNLNSSLPNGTEGPGTVALFNLWTLRWNQQQMGDLFRHYWDAPIFHPTGGAFALSEPQLPTGLVFGVFSALTRSPTLAYNLVLLGALTLNGLAAARLCRRLGIGLGAATLVGVVAQFLPFVFNELGVLQLVVVFPMLFLVDALFSWVDRPDVRRALPIGAWGALTILTCGYYGLFSVVVFGVGGLFLMASLLIRRRSFFTPARLVEVAAALALAAVLAGPILYQQSRYTSGYSRPDSLILGNSAQPSDYLRLDPELPGGFPRELDQTRTLVPWLQPGAGHERLYPGTLLLGLALAGVGLLWAGDFRAADEREERKRRTAAPAPSASAVEPVEPVEPGAAAGTGTVVPGDRRRPERVFLGAAVVTAALLSLGLRFDLYNYVPSFLSDEHFIPYGLVRDHVPGFGDLRSPFRAGVLAQLFLLPFAGIALDRLWRWKSPRQGAPHRVGVGMVLAIVLVTVGLTEVAPMPQQLVDVPAVGRGTDWVDWLADHHDATWGDDSVAMVPFPASGNYRDYQDTTVAMLAALDHDHPLVNGYSGLFPPAYNRIEPVMQKEFPSAKAVEALVSHRVSWLVIDRTWLTPEHLAALAPWADTFVPAFEGESRNVYRFRPAGA